MQIKSGNRRFGSLSESAVWCWLESYFFFDGCYEKLPIRDARKSFAGDCKGGRNLNNFFVSSLDPYEASRSRSRCDSSRTSQHNRWSSNIFGIIFCWCIKAINVIRSSMRVSEAFFGAAGSGEHTIDRERMRDESLSDRNVGKVVLWKLIIIHPRLRRQHFFLSSSFLALFTFLLTSPSKVNMAWIANTQQAAHIRDKKKCEENNNSGIV